MRVDIYNRSPEDPNFVPDQLEMDDTLELFKQEIESVLLTPKTSVMGSTDFGASLDEFVWSFRTSASALQALLTTQITSYCFYASEYSFEVNVQFYHGTIKDIAQIDIIIDNRDKFSVLVG